MAYSFEDFKSQYQRLQSEIASYEREFNDLMQTVLSSASDESKEKLRQAISVLDRIKMYKDQLYHLLDQGYV